MANTMIVDTSLISEIDKAIASWKKCKSAHDATKEEIDRCNSKINFYSEAKESITGVLKDQIINNNINDNTGSWNKVRKWKENDYANLSISEMRGNTDVFKNSSQVTSRLDSISSSLQKQANNTTPTYQRAFDQLDGKNPLTMATLAKSGATLIGLECAALLLNPIFGFAAAEGATGFAATGLGVLLPQIGPAIMGLAAANPFIAIGVVALGAFAVKKLVSKIFKPEITALWSRFKARVRTDKRTAKTQDTLSSSSIQNISESEIEQRIKDGEEKAKTQQPAQTKQPVQEQPVQEQPVQPVQPVQEQPVQPVQPVQEQPVQPEEEKKKTEQPVQQKSTLENFKDVAEEINKTPKDFKATKKGKKTLDEFISTYRKLMADAYNPQKGKKLSLENFKHQHFIKLGIDAEKAMKLQDLCDYANSILEQFTTQQKQGGAQNQNALIEANTVLAELENLQSNINQEK